MSYQARDAYLESKVLAADPLELIRILYQAAIEAVANARRCLTEGDIPGRSREITRAHSILTELTLSLNHEAGPIAGNLAELYDYMQRRLLEAHVTQTEGPLVEVSALLATLLEGWNQCRPEMHPARAATEPPPETMSEYAGYVVQSWTG